MVQIVLDLNLGVRKIDNIAYNNSIFFELNRLYRVKYTLITTLFFNLRR